MSFRDQEKARYQPIKAQVFTAVACQPGIYQGKPRDFCLADTNAEENLFTGFRDDAMRYFSDRGIHWHDGDGGKPSNHLCCSQTCCVNFLWPMVKHPDLLADVFHPFYPEMAEVLPLDADQPLPDGRAPSLAFEWIGTQEYLPEKGRQRGANATSTDFAFRFRRRDGRIHLVLGEWKYTEMYGATPSDPSSINATRLRVYRDAFARWQSSQPDLPAYENFFVEPYYQLMRQTLLAQEMEYAGTEMDAEIVSVLHIAPKANRDFSHNLASFPTLSHYNRTVGSAWTHLAPEDRFLSITTESLRELIRLAAPPALQDWKEYLLIRYGW